MNAIVIAVRSEDALDDFADEHGITREDAERAVEEGLVRSVDDAEEAGALPGPLAGIANITAGPNTTKPKQAGGLVKPEFEAYVSLAGLIDVAAEMKRLEKQIADKQKSRDGVKANLANEKFGSGAPPEVVQQQRDLLADIEKQIAALEENLKDLRSA